MAGKNSVKNKRKAFFIFACICIIFAVGTAALSIYSQNFGQFYNQPKMGVSEIDIKGYDIDSNYSSLILQGEWEFFYNKWIITDNLTEAVPDGYIRIPSRWSGKTYNGVKLPREGYASYRMTIKNPQSGVKVACVIIYQPIAYRIYINGKLNVNSGRVSKNLNETFVMAEPSEIIYYTVENGEALEIVVEISANKNGGLTVWPTLNTDGRIAKLNHWFGTLMQYVALGFMVPVILAVIILNTLNIYQPKNNSIAIMIAVMLVKYLISYDIFYKLTDLFTFLDYRLIRITTYISCFVLYLALINVLYRHNIIVSCDKKKLYILLGINVAAGMIYAFLYGYYIMFLFLAVPFITMLYFIYQVCLAVSQKRKFSKIYLVLLIFVYINYFLEAAELTGLILVNIMGIDSIGTIITMLTVLLVYLVQIKDKIAQSHRAIALEKEITEVKNKALKAQIKPHFVFNMLTNIQDQYHKNLMTGDHALTKFSKHLRLNVDSEYKDMVNFEEELNNIQNYFDLENIRHEGKLNLLYDIDYIDFNLPILSLQPLIENAIKYAKTEKKEDGYIQIKSYTDNGNIIVEVNDNGVGFNASDIKDNSVGLKNITQRLKFSLNADVKIQSVIGIGTTIKIIIPKVKNNENNSD